MSTNYIKTLEENREAKNHFFKEHWQSPIEKDERKKFTEINYFPVDEKYRFELELLIHANPDQFESADSKGDVRQFYRFGEFHFKIEGQDAVLQAYKSDLSEPRLFIPFKDTTNGLDTYGAGRYMDLEDDHHKTQEGKWIFDFNLAYNPYCAYNHNYACPLTPFENHLKIAIKAGEKKYH
jgi:hypothetical protein